VEDVRYPVGRPNLIATLDAVRRKVLIKQIAEAPKKLRAAVTGLTKKQLDTPYRKDGWTVRQVLHHVPDSHLNGYTRFKLTLTENVPTIKLYEEAGWASLTDTKISDPEWSLILIDVLHKRWNVLLKSMNEDDFCKTLIHPEKGTLNLNQMLCLYAWHGVHHVAHITGLRERMGWNESKKSKGRVKVSGKRKKKWHQITQKVLGQRNELQTR